MQFIQSAFPFIVWAALTPAALLFLRVLLAVMFIDGGRRHMADPKGRGKGLGLPASFTFILGLAEVVGGLLVLAGFFTYVGALLLIVVMLGAIYFKVFVWKTGIYGSNNNGWYYDALLLAASGVLLTIGAGAISLDALIQ